MILIPEEFRCREFFLVQAGDEYFLAHVNDMIGELLDHGEAVDRILNRLGETLSRPVPQVAAYRAKPVERPLCFDQKF